MALEIKNFRKGEDVSALPDNVPGIVIRNKTAGLIRWYVREIFENAMILERINKMYSEGKTSPESLYNYMGNNDKDVVMSYLKMCKKQ